MGAIADAFNTAFRAYVVDGVSGSGLNSPDKAEVRAIGPLVEAAIAAPNAPLTKVGTTFTPIASELNQGWMVDDGGGGAVTITLPDLGDGSTFFGFQVGTGQVSFVGDTGITVDCDQLSLPTTACVGACFQAYQDSPTHWYVFGKLEVA